MYSVLIKKARLVDGSGGPERVCDIAIEGENIVAVAPEITTSAATTINAEGKIVTPGFIDIQNHSDSYWQLFDNPALESMVAQGYTTILVGNCGASLAPLLSPPALLALQKWHNTDGWNVDWQTFGEFADTMNARRFGCNVASLIGYSTLRRGIVGDSNRPLTPDELEIMRIALEQAIEQGGFGLSIGLAYSHEMQTSELELYQIAQVIKKNDALLSVHLRNEGDSVVDSVREVIDLARISGLNLKISHLKIRNRSNWDKAAEVMEQLEVAWHQGVNIHYDAYPYTTIWQMLYSYLPGWAIQGGRSHLLQHLSDPVQRNKILSELNNNQAGLRDLIITSTSAGLSVVGKTIAALAKDMEISSEAAILKLVENGGSEVLVFDESLDPKTVSQFSRHPLSMVASDGGGFPGNVTGRLVHPRCFGAAPKFLSEIIQDKSLELPEAVRKLTSLPAKKIGLKNRGQIAPGYFADLVMFDPGTLKDNATVLNPFQYNTGIELVLVNGAVTVRNDKPVKNLNGKFISK
jgi:N-acyl-D-aspartate/D-glutamate deacylase